MRTDGNDLILAVSCKLFEMDVPTFQIILLPNLFNYSKGEQLRVELGEGSSPEELLCSNHYIVFEKFNERVIE